MLTVLKFIFKCVADLISMLFTIEISENFSLGLLFTIIFIFLPTTLLVINFLKYKLGGD